MPPTHEGFKKAFLQWEAAVAAQWSAQLRDPAFMRWLWQQMELQCRQQRLLTDAVRTQLAQRLPHAAEENAALQAEISAARAQIAAARQQLEAIEALLREAGA